MTFFLINYWHLILLIVLVVYGAFTLLRYVFDTRKEVHEIKQELAEIDKKLDNHIQDAVKQKNDLLNAIEEGVKRSKNHNTNNLEVVKQFIKEFGLAESIRIISGGK